MHGLSFIMNITYDCNENCFYKIAVVFNDINMKRNDFQDNKQIEYPFFCCSHWFWKKLSTGILLFNDILLINTATFLF